MQKSWAVEVAEGICKGPKTTIFIHKIFLLSPSVNRSTQHWRTVAENFILLSALLKEYRGR